MMNDFKPVKKLIVNSPYKKPSQYYEYARSKKRFILKEGRRKASYIVAGGSKKSYDEYGQTVSIALTNEIRNRLKEWQIDGYKGITGVTKRLLEYWKDEHIGRNNRFFFCQLEAIESLIFILEAPANFKQGIDIPKDEDLRRYCCKMATGTGKTVVMSMVIVWQILNKVAYPNDSRFARNILIVAPNLTVKERLETALSLDDFNNETYYSEFKILPSNQMEKLRQGKVLIQNWHQIQYREDNKQTGVDKRGAKSNYAHVRETLHELSNSKGIVVINDEAHHAWRGASDTTTTEDFTREDKEQATKWIDGLDRINKTVGIRNVFDFSATPYMPQNKGEKIFDWIVSDFGLTDAIEAGLVKTPRFAVRDDAAIDKTTKPKLYHIYEANDTKSKLAKKKEKTASLPEIVKIAYMHLSESWESKYEKWYKDNKNKEQFKPPVIISVVNNTTTADRVEHAFKTKTLDVSKKLYEIEKTVKIHSDLDKDIGDDLKQKLLTIGEVGKDGQFVHHVISVAMLSEGWDCKTVTHIMGLRAFSSQLLCEQTVGRGLRRTSYELNEYDMFDQEYVSVLGVPFSFLPQEGEDKNSLPESQKTCIFPVSEKERYKIVWPNIEKIDRTISSKLALDISKVDSFVADVSKIPIINETAPLINGNPKYEDIALTDLQEFLHNKYNTNRKQTLILKIAEEVYGQVTAPWKQNSSKDEVVGQIFRLVEEFINSSKFKVKPNYEYERKNMVIMIKMDDIVHHVYRQIQKSSTTSLSVHYGQPKFSSTSDCTQWWTKKNTAHFEKTHMNLCVVDSNWELAHARELDRNEHVLSWVKNDKNLAFKIDYIDEQGTSRKYIPDFLIKLKNDQNIILEVKGIKKERDIKKWDFMTEWCKAVSEDLDEKWIFETSMDPTGRIIHQIVQKYT